MDVLPSREVSQHPSPVVADLAVRAYMDADEEAMIVLRDALEEDGDTRMDQLRVQKRRRIRLLAELAGFQTLDHGVDNFRVYPFFPIENFLENKRDRIDTFNAIQGEEISINVKSEEEMLVLQHEPHLDSPGLWSVKTPRGITIFGRDEWWNTIVSITSAVLISLDRKELPLETRDPRVVMIETTERLMTDHIAPTVAWLQRLRRMVDF